MGRFFKFFFRCFEGLFLKTSAADNHITAWYRRNGFRQRNDGWLVEKSKAQRTNSRENYSPPILFLARGHSGTRLVCKLLEKAGVYLGDTGHTDSLNDTFDSLYWSYGFERTLLPRFFVWGEGCEFEEDAVMRTAQACTDMHMRGYEGGAWGFKTCGAMFSHQLYRYVFPEAKYIYLVRDGRDVVLSNDGKLNLAGASPCHPHWEFFKIITFGISNDMDAVPFNLNAGESSSNITTENRFWIQAKSWVEHERMMRHLKNRDELSDNVYLLSYEKLCEQPINTISKLFDFLEIEFTEEMADYAVQNVSTGSINRWARLSELGIDTSEDMDKVFNLMVPELKYLGYRQ